MISPLANFTSPLVEDYESLSQSPPSKGSFEEKIFDKIIASYPYCHHSISKELREWVQSLNIPIAYLLPQLIEGNKEKKYPLGIACSHKNVALFKKFFKDIPVFNIEDKSLENQIKAISSCKYLISSSLNAIKIAHAYQVPVAWVNTNLQPHNPSNLEIAHYFTSIKLPSISCPYVYHPSNSPTEQAYLMELCQKMPQPQIPPITKQIWESFPLHAIKKNSNIKPLVILRSGEKLEGLLDKELLALLPHSHHLKSSSNHQIGPLKKQALNYLFVDIHKNPKDLGKQLQSLKEKIGPSQVIFAIRNPRHFAHSQNLNFEKIHDLAQDIFQSSPHFFVLEKYFDQPILEIEKILDFLHLPKLSLLPTLKKRSFTHFDKTLTSFFQDIHKNKCQSPNKIASAYDRLSKRFSLHLPLFGYPTKQNPLKLTEKERQYPSQLSCLKDKFDQVYVINLDRSQQRLVKLDHHLKEMGGLNYQRFSAIDGKKLNNKQDYNTSKILEFGGYGTLGCYLSHFNVIKEALEKNYKSILVLEDDVRFSSSISTVLPKAFEKLPKDWDILYLGGRCMGSEKNLSEHLVKGKALTAYSYALSRKGMQIIYDSIIKAFEEKLALRPIDEQLLNLSTSGKLKTYLLKPYVAYFANSLPSTHSQKVIPSIELTIKEELLHFN